MESEFETAIQQYVDLGFPSVLLTPFQKKSTVKILSSEQRYCSFLISVWMMLIYSSFFNSFSFPLRFSSAQAELYEAVLEVQRSCLSLCSPGVSLDHIYSTMLALLGRQLMQLGIIKAATSDADALKVQKENKRLNKLLPGRFTVSLTTR